VQSFAKALLTRLRQEEMFCVFSMICLLLSWMFGMWHLFIRMQEFLSNKFSKLVSGKRRMYNVVRDVVPATSWRNVYEYKQDEVVEDQQGGITIYRINDPVPPVLRTALKLCNVFHKSKLGQAVWMEWWTNILQLQLTLLEDWYVKRHCKEFTSDGQLCTKGRLRMILNKVNILVHVENHPYTLWSVTDAYT